MATFLISEVYIVERTISSGHSDLDDLTCEATVCTSEHQAHCEAIKNMIRLARDKSCDSEEEESLRFELVKTMRRKGINVERRYKRVKDLLIGASRAFNAEKIYYNVKRSEIIPHEEVDEQTMIQDALEHLGASDGKAGTSPGSSTRKAKQISWDPAIRGRGRVLPPLSTNAEGLTTKKARDQAGRSYVPFYQSEEDEDDY